MVKDTRYIIKKVIIGVLIALILMFLKTNVFAVELEKGYASYIPPNSFCYIPAGGSSTCPAIKAYSDPNIGTYYGADLSGGSGYGAFVWYLPVLANVQNTDYYNALGDMTFIYRAQNAQANSDVPMNFFVRGVSSGKVITCENDSSLIIHGDIDEGVYIGLRQYTGVRCRNVNLNEDYRIYQTASSFQNGYPGITRVTTIIKENASKEISNGIKETNETIKDSSVDNDKASSDIDTMNGKVASNGTITDLLTLPIQLYQAILNNVDGSCSPINLGSLYNHNLRLTCINLSNLLGSTLYNIIDVLCCGLFILAFRKKMVDIFNHMTSLNDRGNELE